MPETVESLAHLPMGSHCVSFYVSREEAASQAVDFLAGTPKGQAASFWVPDLETVAYYQNRLAVDAPDQADAVHFLATEQIQPQGGKLRPVEEVAHFVAAHPEGVSAAGETLSRYMTSENVPDHLEYEAWFDEQPRSDSRFLCPYDLRRVPLGQAPEFFRTLGAHHSHTLLSDSTEPAVRLLQLFVFATAPEVPRILEPTLGWAVRGRLLEFDGDQYELGLAPKGEKIVQDWGDVAAIGW
jgi:MEDS: MEthanogen/methylotroph, DcmR Sensory domain